MKQSRPHTKVTVIFQDEARFGQQGTLTRVWAPRGSRPTVLRQNGRESVWVFAAVEPSTGWTTTMVSSTADIRSMQLFVDRVAAGLEHREHAVMVLDRAGWHTSRKLRWPKRITPLFLPPYSPELNPVERLWHWLRQHCWSNRCFDTKEDLIIEALEGAWSLDWETIRSVCRAAWIVPEDQL